VDAELDAMMEHANTLATNGFIKIISDENS